MKPLSVKVKTLPKSPGIYLFKDVNKKVIYVGKAKDLKVRVSSYFKGDIPLGSKTRVLANKIKSIDFVEVESELEALLLEADLIKRYKPQYNVAMKDDKSYKYIVVKNEKLKVKNYNSKFKVIPKIITLRKKDINKEDIYFGPYPQGKTVDSVLKRLRRVFPYRDCSKTKFKTYKRFGRTCIFGDIGVCPGPCVEGLNRVVFDPISENKKNIENIKKFIRGGKKRLIKNLESRMRYYSKKKNYENAAKIRDQTKSFEYLLQTFRLPEKYIEHPNLMEDQRRQALNELIDILSSVFGYQISVNRIECFDVSNIGGSDAVAGMSVGINGKLETSEYRKFRMKFRSAERDPSKLQRSRIRAKDTPDPQTGKAGDPTMIAEALKRRLKRAVPSGGWPRPDLIILDGGKGQLSKALELKPEVPVISIAKREERIFIPDGTRPAGRQGRIFTSIKLKKDSEALKLIMKLRDEAHRFALNYHRQLRLKMLKK